MSQLSRLPTVEEARATITVFARSLDGALGQTLDSDAAASAALTIGRATVGRTLSDFEAHRAAFAADPARAIVERSQDDLQLGALLGRGGMGRVHEGEQRELRRRVAVKQMSGDEHDPERRAMRMSAFLREAWIGASLAHPNIVPIHALSAHEGTPALVMKRIEGVSWRSLLDDDDAARALGMEDRLRFHLEILIRVARALHFAHSRGIVHLDLKPDNVMVGDHGEVYLVDWGLAATVDEAGPAWLPKASDIDRTLGTPRYLAPEQTIGSGPHIGPRTDVFLLGALVHRIVTGGPPHRSESIAAVLFEALTCAPKQYGDDVPPRLVAILETAMARAPEDRFESAEDVREALEAFLRLRDADALVADALSRLDALDSARATHPDDALARRGEAECRIALEEARRLSPADPALPKALDRLHRGTFERALARGAWRQAAAALEHVREALPEDHVRVAAARERERAAASERRALRDLGAAQDILRHAATRSRTALFVGTGWALWFLFVARLRHAGVFELSHPLLVGNALGSMAVYGVVMFAVRDTLMRTIIDRRILFSLAVVFAGVCVLWSLAWIVDAPPLDALRFSNFAYLFFFLLTTLALYRRSWWMFLGLTPVLAASIADPNHTLEWQALYVALGAYGSAFLWWRDARSLRDHADA